MKYCLLAVLLALGLCSCATYSPLRPREGMRKEIGQKFDTKSGIQITFLGNSTLYIDDGKTSLLVDGFLSRPGFFNTTLGKVGPNMNVIHHELDTAKIKKIDAILVGHAHHDHALDATAIADEKETTVVGSESFAQIYQGSHDPKRNSKLVVIRNCGGTFTKGSFRVHLIPSEHVGPHIPGQAEIEGHITWPLKLPAKVLDFKCGEVFVLYITHPDGNFVVTTTAGAKKGQLYGTNANVIFLGVGLLTKEKPEQKQEFYWRETVDASHASVIVPVHWDNFMRKLSCGRHLTVPPAFDNPRSNFEFVKTHAGGRPVRVLDHYEKVYLRGGQVYIPAPERE